MQYAEQVPVNPASPWGKHLCTLQVRRASARDHCKSIRYAPVHIANMPGKCPCILQVHGVSACAHCKLAGQAPVIFASPLGTTSLHIQCKRKKTAIGGAKLIIAIKLGSDRFETLLPNDHHSHLWGSIKSREPSTLHENSIGSHHGDVRHENYPVGSISRTWSVFCDLCRAIWVNPTSLEPNNRHHHLGGSLGCPEPG
ncbi:hypothetical protein CRG98_028506 [Punica granatum]|uniref:Uncharacterized protein n=1 Tax=Punica granatum TaxID=22663 RepID=A0A2I0J4B4_PUNGR|nr:hypothetical protein CRG98_028506 [Punica granatum]